MKSIESTLGLLAGILIFTNVQADFAANQTLCLKGVDSKNSYSEDIILHYSQAFNNHFSFFGQTCYQSKSVATFADCYPVHGSGITFEGKIELSMAGTETDSDAGQVRYSEISTHYALDPNTLKGTWAAEKVVSYEDGLEIQQFLKGTVETVNCP